MLKKKLIAVMMSAFCLAAAIPSMSVMADGQKVVTLGADLSDEQRTMILKYFGVYGETVETLTITNADEREHLGSYISLEQIGTRTYSCAMVNPTTSGGIQVKTANLTYVTSNMIASTLSTSGVVNCEVLAAAPFAVSGTGALTGILMAYETASGETLDEEKKETATQELVTTTSIANNIGQVEATQIVNETKIQVIENNIDNSTDIEVVINEVADEEDITLSDEDRALLVELLEKIAEQDYNYEEMSETLERVEENLDELMSNDTSSEEGSTAEADTQAESGETEQTLSNDSILLNTDDSALGTDVVIDATNEAALTETDAQTEDDTVVVIETEAATEAVNDSGLEITVSDSYTNTTAGTDSSDDITIDVSGSDDVSEITISDAEDSADTIITGENAETETAELNIEITFESTTDSEYSEELGYDVYYESAVITAYDENNNVLWTYQTDKHERAQLTSVYEIGQKDDAYYFVEGGFVIALDLTSGEKLWQNDDFGGSGDSVLGENAIYLCGYLGPDFCAISYDGQTIKRIDAFDSANYWWPYEITLNETETGVAETMAYITYEGTGELVMLGVDLTTYAYTVVADTY